MSESTARQRRVLIPKKEEVTHQSLQRQGERGGKGGRGREDSISRGYWARFPGGGVGLTSAERDVEDQMLGREELVDGAARRGVVGHGCSKRRGVD